MADPVTPGAGVPKLTYDVPEDVSNIILKQAVQEASISALATVGYVPDGRDRVVYSLNLDDAQWHKDLSKLKVPDTKGVSSVTVPMFDLYKMFYMDETLAADTPTLVKNLQAQMGLILGETLEKSVFGPTAVPTSPFPGFGTTQNGDLNDPAVLVALADTVPTANGWIWSTAGRGYIRNALTKGTVTSPANFAVNDGIEVVGLPSHFVDLGTVDTGTIAGVVGDFRHAVLLIANSIKLQVVTSDTDSTLMENDAVAIKVKMRAGFAIDDPKYFKAFAYAAPTAAAK